MRFRHHLVAEPPFVFVVPNTVSWYENTISKMYKYSWKFENSPSCQVLFTREYIETLKWFYNTVVYDEIINAYIIFTQVSSRWRHNGRESVSNHQHHHCLLNRLFRRRSKKTPKLRVTGRCAGNSPGTGEFPAQMASNAENASIWWRHHGIPRNTFLVGASFVFGVVC